MARDLPIGNGSLLVSFDQQYCIRDCYFPLVGQENHTAGHRFYLGVWTQGLFSWVSDESWERQLAYEPNTLATQVSLQNTKLGLSIVASDVVDFQQNVLIRRFRITNLNPAVTEVRLFLHHDFHV
ncbi:hypothetical protein [Sulfobacillus harzensis]|uniref:Uncharacterized protein n=1 Tax=Sulfobacillus harzensis TaxID=2729629 RepID=A0A7Y0Q3D8_9FIRM|nr:hypothetical protein [Sulfobacillus harzensis]NMP24138.1 hypothetical protein [Sulfobacillus harzensis]